MHDVERATRERPGSCLCGGVRYVVRGPMRDVLDCHCIRCRKATGHHIAASSARIVDIELAEPTTLRWFHPADDPDVAYGFCGECGASAFWTHLGLDTWSVCAGLLDDTSGLVTAEQWWTSHAGDYVHLDPGIPAYATQPGSSADAAPPVS